jgi:hypothetical protein
LKVALRAGDVVRPCKQCGKSAEAHHPDYTKPYDVLWLCSYHHQRWHKENGRGFIPAHWRHVYYYLTLRRKNSTSHDITWFHACFIGVSSYAFHACFTRYLRHS